LKAAPDDMREAQSAATSGAWTGPSKRTTESWLDEWVTSLRLGPSTVAGYLKNIRLHLKPSIGDVPLASLPPPG